MFVNLEYMDAEKTAVRAKRPDGSYVIVEPVDADLWSIVQSGKVGGIAEYIPPPPPTDAELLASERQAMRCHAVQFRLALHRDGNLSRAQAIADSDPELLIVWDRTVHFHRSSRFVTALIDDGFTPEAVDELFRTAMSIAF